MNYFFLVITVITVTHPKLQHFNTGILFSYPGLVCLPLGQIQMNENQLDYRWYKPQKKHHMAIHMLWHYISMWQNPGIQLQSNWHPLCINSLCSRTHTKPVLNIIHLAPKHSKSKCTATNFLLPKINRAILKQLNLPKHYFPIL